MEEVAAHIREKGYVFDAEEFWNFYESKGWRIGSHVMKSWQSACVTWQKKREHDAMAEAARTAHYDAKMAEHEAARTAHIDAKMDAREKKRETQMASRRHADNWIAPTPEQIKEFEDDFS